MVRCDHDACEEEAEHVRLAEADDGGKAPYFARCDSHYDSPPYREDLLDGPVPAAER